MRLLTDLLLAGYGLLKGEMRDIRHSVVQLITALALLAISFLFIVMAIGLLAAGAWLAIAPATGHAGAAFILGGGMLVIALLFALAARGTGR
ncbi:MAG: hypothetical protein ACOC93_04745 [Planctomycetota bacterium]